MVPTCLSNKLNTISQELRFTTNHQQIGNFFFFFFNFFIKVSNKMHFHIYGASFIHFYQIKTSGLITYFCNFSSLNFYTHLFGSRFFLWKTFVHFAENNIYYFFFIMVKQNKVFWALGLFYTIVM